MDNSQMYRKHTTFSQLFSRFFCVVKYFVSLQGLFHKTGKYVVATPLFKRYQEESRQDYHCYSTDSKLIKS